MVTANEILTLHEKNSPLIDEDSWLAEMTNQYQYQILGTKN